MPKDEDTHKQTEDHISFDKEPEFEDALTHLLTAHGWEEKMLMYPTEEDLIENWRNIIYENNCQIDRLDKYPLTATEMQQIIQQVQACGSPFKVNRLINGELVQITRDNPDDRAHNGKVVYLKIFDAHEIAGGKSRYQIARQPKFKSSLPLAGDKRGDFMLLINGMPVIHVELKRSKVDVSQAVYQIVQRYVHEGIFAHGIFALVQIFVAMTPEDMVYFANAGKEEDFKKEFMFHWADFDNRPINDWQKLAATFLSIPMAHQMVGLYTVADDKDRSLKVLRSYQYYAVSAISDKVRNAQWDVFGQRGGYVWHTTGSGKTMTSFKAAELIKSNFTDVKVVFVMDRIELGTQSLDEYRGFAGESETIQDTDDTSVLVAKLKSNDDADRLIVTSINKLYNVRAGEQKVVQSDIDKIDGKHIVFIFDECHRSVYGKMLLSIKRVFPCAIFFGFTGTPIIKDDEDNELGEVPTTEIFGNELCRYTIADGIRDGNVLAFDPYKVETYKELELRKKIALRKADAATVKEAMADDVKKKAYLHWMNKKEVTDLDIENELPADQYATDEHHEAVVQNILDNWETLSLGGKFHAILATKNIPEAIAYYKLFKSVAPQMKVVAVFDDSIDNDEHAAWKLDNLLEMLDDYNHRYGMCFAQSSYALYKKDVQYRLAHKRPYNDIDNEPDKQIDILIVVTQMLTGYDSKWVNTLYCDKLLRKQNLIQAFSRTNRLFGHEKPFGIIKYYTLPYTMEQNVQRAFKKYSGDKPFGIFVDKLEEHLNTINSLYLEIKKIFNSDGIIDFRRLPDSKASRNMFAKRFAELTHFIERAKLQGFVWEKTEYEFRHSKDVTTVKMLLDERTYEVMRQRYKELFADRAQGNGGDDDVPYQIEAYITETGTGTIDAEYLDSKFRKYVKNLYTEGPGSENTRRAVQDLHKSFASLSQDDQVTAILILHDIERGDLHLEQGKTLQDYIANYQKRESNRLVDTFAEATGLDKKKLREMINLGLTEKNINEFNRFNELLETLDSNKKVAFVEKVFGKKMKSFIVNIKMKDIVKEFVIYADKRKAIIDAWRGKATKDEEGPKQSADEMFERMVQTSAKPQPKVEIKEETLRERVGNAVGKFFHGADYGVRNATVLTGKLYAVLNAKSIPELDGVGMFIDDALGQLFVETPTIVKRSNALHALLMRFEAFLKKLYFIINGKELRPFNPAEKDATMKDAIKAFDCLRDLRVNPKPQYQRMFENLRQLHSWRNSEAHVSPTFSEKELNSKIQSVLSVYYFVVGKELSAINKALSRYHVDPSSNIGMAAEPQE